ncbi:MAG TPA: hypothetical protein VIC55_03655 [Gemmatimonadaceae bacterium]|jgi:hypothetical protein
MKYPVDYVRYAAREMRKMESRFRVGEEAPMSQEQLADVLKAVWKALDEIGDAIEGLQRSRD